MDHARQRKIILGATLARKVKRLAKRDIRPMTYQIAYLCQLALKAPQEPEPLRGQADLESDPPRSGLTSIALGVAPGLGKRIFERTMRTGESWSQAIRQLLRHGIAIERLRDEILKRAANGKEE